jgi:2,4-dienoyl-CoA reductase (NADPH2)
VTARLRGAVAVPLITTNRINDPAVAEAILGRGDADMVSMARPFLADPEWMRKAREDRGEDINTCIACNQACLDHVFENRRASCLVNPRACHETELVITPATRIKRIAVVGSGPAGLAFATALAERGHRVTLFEQAPEIGGQFNMARRIPGKEEFAGTLRYFGRRLAQLGVELRLGTTATPELLRDAFDEVVLATGVTPRRVDIPGSERANVLSYVQVLQGAAEVGPRVAIIGAGGIGFDVAEFLVEATPSPTLEVQRWSREWGVDTRLAHRAGLAAREPEPPLREVWLLQRTPGRLGQRLNRTTGWVHRATLKAKRVRQLGGVGYERIDEAGLHVTVDGAPQLLEVDTVVICAGQEPNRQLHAECATLGVPLHLIGGADVAAELDAKRAIAQGTRLAAAL